MIGGDFNALGVSLLDFLVAFNLLVVNLWFEKKDDHLVTFRSTVAKTQIDYFLFRRTEHRFCRYCKVLPREGLTTQHRLLVLDAKLEGWRRKGKLVGQEKIKWWRLDANKIATLRDLVSTEREWEGSEDANIMWERMVGKIRKTAKKVLGVSRGKGQRREGIWWWNEEIQEKVKAKQEAYARLLNCETEEEKAFCREEYKKN